MHITIYIYILQICSNSHYPLLPILVLALPLGLKVKSTVIYNYVFIIGVLTPLAKPIVL
jgi:hypothetical protein